MALLFRRSRSLKQPKTARTSEPVADKPVADKPFDAESYWLERHERLRGDIRSVGNLGMSEERNRAGEAKHRRYLKTFLEHMYPDASDKMALDLGCGIGRLAPAFVEHGFRYTGVEVSPVAVEQARLACPDEAAEFVVASFVTYQDSRRFDLIVASYVLVHIVKDEEWMAALRSIASWLRDDGYFVLIDEVPVVAAPERNRPHFVSRTVEQYEAALARCGLRFVDSWRDADREALGPDKLERYFVIERQDSRRPARRHSTSG
jgi:SAM-dependent methyltransferase